MGHGFYLIWDRHSPFLRNVIYYQVRSSKKIITIRKNSRHFESFCGKADFQSASNSGKLQPRKRTVRYTKLQI